MPLFYRHFETKTGGQRIFITRKLTDGRVVFWRSSPLNKVKIASLSETTNLKAVTLADNKMISLE